MQPQFTYPQQPPLPNNNQPSLNLIPPEDDSDLSVIDSQEYSDLMATARQSKTFSLSLSCINTPRDFFDVVGVGAKVDGNGYDYDYVDGLREVVSEDEGDEGGSLHCDYDDYLFDVNDFFGINN